MLRSLLLASLLSSSAVGLAQDLAAPVTISLGPERPLASVALDLDGVPPLEVVSACGGDGLVLVDGAGNRSILADAAWAAGAFSVEVVDLDGDGHDDLLWGAASPTEVIGWNRGVPGGLTGPAHLTVPGALGAVRGIDARDVDNDGVPDVAAAVSGSGGGVCLLHGLRGGGNFALVQSPNWLHQGTSTFAARLEDLDGDGLLDLLTSRGGDLVAYRGTPGGITATAPLLVTSGLSGVRAVEAEDLDGDGILDVAAATSGGGAIPGQVLTILQSSPGTFAQAEVHLSGPLYRCVVAQDLDGNGAVDLIATAADVGEVWAVPGAGGGQFATPVLLSGSSQDCYGIALADLDFDGDQDVVVSVVNDPGSSGRQEVFENLRGFGFTDSSAVTFASGGAMDCMTAMDIDRDGDLDLVGVEAGAVLFCPNDGGGAFGGTQVFFFDPMFQLGVVKEVTGWDEDGDGWEELFLCRDSSWVAFSTSGTPFPLATALPTGGSQARFADLGSNGTLEVIYRQIATGVGSCGTVTSWLETRAVSVVPGGSSSWLAGREDDSWCDGLCHDDAGNFLGGWAGRFPSGGAVVSEYHSCDSDNYHYSWAGASGPAWSPGGFGAGGYTPLLAVHAGRALLLNSSYASSPGFGVLPSFQGSVPRYCSLTGPGVQDVIAFREVLAGSSPGAVYWAEAGTFDHGPERLIGRVAEVDFLFAADVDGDGDEDVFAGTTAGEVTWWRNQLPFDDCNNNGVADWSDLAGGVETDCDGDGVLDSCQWAQDPSLDWNGDGVLDVCSPAIYCQANVNMDGLEGGISAEGSPLLSENNFLLRAIDLPVNQFGYFLFSRSQAYVNPFGGGAGVLCLGPPIRRFNGTGQVLNTGSVGHVSLQVDLTNLPAATALSPGDVLNFQFWHREYDTFGNPTSNTTDAIEVCFR